MFKLRYQRRKVTDVYQRKSYDVNVRFKITDAKLNLCIVLKFEPGLLLGILLDLCYERDKYNMCKEPFLSRSNTASALIATNFPFFVFDKILEKVYISILYKLVLKIHIPATKEPDLSRLTFATVF